MNFALILSIIGGIILLIGLAGTVIPILPGAPLAWFGLLLSYFSSYNEISVFCLVLTAVFAVAVSVLDNLCPIFMTKKFGGSKAAVTGTTVGLIIGFFTGPWGIILGPFLGAFIGELVHTNGKTEGVFKSAFGAFMGFLLGTGLKIICVLIFIWIYILSFF